MALTDWLTAFYEFESGSLLVDQVSGLTLTNSASAVTSVSGGIVGNASSYVAASSQFLSHTSSPLLQPTSTMGISVSIWFKPTSLPASGFPGLVTKQGEVAGGQSYGFAIDNAGTLYWSVFDSSDNKQDATAIAATAGVWTFAIGTYDPTDKKGRLYVNDGAAVVSAVLTNGINLTGTSAFRFGNNSGVAFYNGIMDQSGVWQRVLTSAERTSLYNSGNGLSYAAMLPAFDPAVMLGAMQAQQYSGGMVGRLIV